MRLVRRVEGLVVLQALVLGALAVADAVGEPGIAAGALYGAVCDILILRAVRRTGRLGPADLVTWVRCALVGGVVAVVLGGPGDGAVLVALAGTALLLDGVDGQVARRTRTASAFGARFDMEVDASLVLALSIGAVHVVGPWVLLPGGARYLLLLATRLVPLLDRPTPPRLWRKVVAVAQGVVLGIVCSGLLPRPAAEVITIAAALALGWSFASQVHGLVRPTAVQHLDEELRVRGA